MRSFSRHETDSRDSDPSTGGGRGTASRRRVVFVACLCLLSGCVALEGTDKPVVNPYVPPTGSGPRYDLLSVPDLSDPEVSRDYVEFLSLTLNRSAKQIEFLSTENSELKERLDQTQMRMKDLEDRVGKLERSGTFERHRELDRRSMAGSSEDEPAQVPGGEGAERPRAEGDRRSDGVGDSRHAGFASPSSSSRESSADPLDSELLFPGEREIGDMEVISDGRDKADRNGKGSDASADGSADASAAASAAEAALFDDVDWDDPRAINVRARALRAEGRYAELAKFAARPASNREVKRDKYSINTEYLAIDANYKLRNCQMVASGAKRFVRSHPHSPEAPYAHLRLAICQAALEQKDVARATLRRIIGLYPDGPAVEEAARLLKTY